MFEVWLDVGILKVQVAIVLKNFLGGNFPVLLGFLWLKVFMVLG